MFCVRLEKAVNNLWKVKMASWLLILTQSDKRTKFDKEVELAEDGKHLSAIRRAIKENVL